MRKIKEVLRLKSLGLTSREIAKSVSVARSTIAEYLRRADEAGITWPLPDGLDDAALERLLFKLKQTPAAGGPIPDLRYIHTELKKPGVTLSLLWEEYLAENPDGYRYTQFCHHYRLFRGKLNLCMRQVHKAGEKMFVDFAGQTVPVIDSRTGEIRDAQIFIAALGASNYTFARAVWSQELENWVACHTGAFEFFGGAAAITIPDNLRTGISKACRYEPDVNPTYQDMIEHYGSVVIPARAGHPKDKPKVEVAVQVVERWILARLRSRTFFSLAELNGAIDELLEKLNNRPFAKLEGTRKSLFEAIDRPALKPLPAHPYEFARFKVATVNIDYHIDVFGHYYSVPYQLVKEKVDARVTDRVVEVLFKGRRVASHMRAFKKGGATTEAAHMPRAHRAYLEWTPSRIINWAATVGPNCAAFVEALMEAKKHPEQGYRAALGVIRLAKTYTPERLEAAAARALSARALSYKSVKLILKNNLDSLPEEPQAALPVIEHNNIRGADYYH